MGKTEIYGLQYLEPYQPTNLDLDMDEKRFRTIESQTYVLYSIFGNGIVIDTSNNNVDNSSWRLTTSNTSTQDDLQVQITPGRAHVGFISAFTVNPTTLHLSIPAGAAYPLTLYIYATTNSTTANTGAVDFITSTTLLSDTNKYVGLGGVTLSQNPENYNIIFDIYNTPEYGRKEISLYSVIGDIVSKHKHIGGNYNPSPINLSQHVQGRLSGDYIENLNLSTVTEGTLAPERLPQIDHNDLTRKGTLTHEQIDSLQSSLSKGTDNRLSELTTVNELQVNLGLIREGYPIFEENSINTVTYIPGLTPDRYAANKIDSELEVVAPFVPDTVNLATVNTVDKRIEGSIGGNIVNDFKTWITDFDFIGALTAEENDPTPTGGITKKVSVKGTGQSAYLELACLGQYFSLSTSSLNEWMFGYKINDVSTIDETAPLPDTFQDQYDIQRFLFTTFSKKDLTYADNIAIYFNLPLVNANQGKISASLILQSGGTATSIISNNQPVALNLSTPVIFYDPDDDEKNDFNATIPLSQLVTTEQKKNVIGIAISYASDEVGDSIDSWDKHETAFELVPPLLNPVMGNADMTSAIFAWNDQLFVDSMQEVIFRFDSNYNNTQYNGIFITSTVPNNSDLKVFTRIATTDINNAQRMELGADGTIRNKITAGESRIIDVIVQMTASPTLVSSPTLSDISISYSKPGVTQLPKTWDTAEDWQTGIFNNLTLQGDKLILNNVGDIGEFTYLQGNTAYKTVNGVESSYLSTNFLYLTPWQVFHKKSRGFIDPRHMITLPNGNIIIVDRTNDRVLEMDSSGHIIKGIQGNMRLSKYDRDFVVLTAIYNNTLGKLWITFSQYVSPSVDKTKITLSNGQTAISFDNTSVNVISAALVNNKSATLEITFSGTAKQQVNSWVDQGLPLQIFIDSGAVQCQGSDGGSLTTNTTSTEDTNNRLPDYMIYPQKYGYLNTGALKGSLSKTGEFDPVISPTNIATGDFNNDGEINNTVDAELLGPSELGGRITLNVDIANIIFDQLYAPMYIQCVNSGWLVTAAGQDSVVFYNSNMNRQWAISSSEISLRDDADGSAWQTSNSQVIVAAPAPKNPTTPESTNGEVLIFSRTESRNILLSRIPISLGDAVRAIPYNNETEIFIAVRDSLSGVNSRIIRTNFRGTVQWFWDGSNNQGSNTTKLYAPTDLKVLANNTILVSE